jgi:hypothetical protein
MKVFFSLEIHRTRQIFFENSIASVANQETWCSPYYSFGSGHQLRNAAKRSDACSSVPYLLPVSGGVPT